ncbi:B mating type pheromone [Heterobasidion irregulare TC 32-1]|uniref:B mating type pheromone n=1 Tax=Heterobasidion irregulare (strain TC 32-1) TaxID=747525 RepID=W4K1N0_HETIT|nr:B mating type pheromone [Heterobasidion irregulare TC 32-1]ETW79712.1 B mating type pheromone [Heterobasidion irregulare TC 32-1]
MDSFSSILFTATSTSADATEEPQTQLPVDNERGGTVYSYCVVA